MGLGPSSNHVTVVYDHHTTSISDNTNQYMSTINRVMNISIIINNDKTQQYKKGHVNASVDALKEYSHHPRMIPELLVSLSHV